MNHLISETSFLWTIPTFNQLLNVYIFELCDLRTDCSDQTIYTTTILLILKYLSIVKKCRTIVYYCLSMCDNYIIKIINKIIHICLIFILEMLSMICMSIFAGSHLWSTTSSITTDVSYKFFI